MPSVGLGLSAEDYKFGVIKAITLCFLFFNVSFCELPLKLHFNILKATRWYCGCGHGEMETSFSSFEGPMTQSKHSLGGAGWSSRK